MASLSAIPLNHAFEGSAKVTEEESNEPSIKAPPFASVADNVAVLGSGYYALSEIEELLPIAKSVTMVTNGAEPVQYRKENLSVNEKKIKEIKGSNTVEEIEFKDNSKQKIDGLFVAQGVASSLEFAKKLGAKTENNYILVNEDMETNIPNVYACGDCTGGILQISKAIYEGTKAGLSVINKLRG